MDVDGRPLGSRHTPGARARSLVLGNALTGNAGMWEAGIAPDLEGRAFGTPSFDLPGQGESPPAPAADLGPADLAARMPAAPRGAPQPARRPGKEPVGARDVGASPSAAPAARRSRAAAASRRATPASAAGKPAARLSAATSSTRT